MDPEIPQTIVLVTLVALGWTHALLDAVGLAIVRGANALLIKNS